MDAAQQQQQQRRLLQSDAGLERDPEDHRGGVDEEPITLGAVIAIFQQAAPHAVSCYLARRALTVAVDWWIKTKVTSEGKISQQRLLRVVLYVLSTLQAVFGSLYSLRVSIEADSIRRLQLRRQVGDDAEVHRRKNSLKQQTKTVLEFLIGYLVHDVVAMSEMWHEYPADLVHHFLGITLGTIALARPHATLAFVPAFLRLEASTVLLNFMWFFREFPPLAARFPKTHAALPWLFACSFFLIRMVWFPHYLHRLRTDFPHAWHRGLGTTGQRLVFMLHALQTYWFVLIVKKLLPTAAWR